MLGAAKHIQQPVWLPMLIDRQAHCMQDCSKLIVQADSAAKLPMSTHPLLLASISAAAGAATGALLCAYLLRTGTNVPSRAAAAAGAASPAAAPSTASTLQLDRIEEDDILQEQLTRNVQFFGLEKQKRIGSAFVVVIGLGGVGSHAAHLLLRSGVGRLRLVDFDQVTLSSLNRHAVATRADVGIPKARCLQQHFKEILPEVEALNVMCTADNVGELLSANPDFVLDAIDNIDTKVALLAAAKERGIPVLCVAGAGAKADPTRLRVVDISESSVDPLARAVRQKLRKEHSIMGDVPVLLSTERPRCSLVSLVDTAGADLRDYQVVPNFRIRTIPVLGTTPAIFGMAAAAYILTQLAGAPFYSEPIIQLTGLQYDRALQRLVDREEERYGSSEGVAVDRDDVVYLLREVYRGLSARAPPVIRPGGDKALCRSTADLTFTRWDAAAPATVDNLVLLTQQEADLHDQTTLEQLRQQEPAFVARVEGFIDRVRREVFM